MPTRKNTGVVVVGASLAGLRTAQYLRATGCEDPITLIGDENEAPYDRPPLSKQLLAGAKEPSDVYLAGTQQLVDENIGLLCGRRAIALAEREVVLEDGEYIPYSRLVIATGVSARMLGERHPESCVHVLRTLQDAVRLRTALETARHLVVVGAGFIGAEVATVARSHGIEVTMLEALRQPFGRVLGPEVGCRCAQLQQDHGVRLLPSTTMKGVETSGGSARVLLPGGGVIEADCILVAIGTVPNNAWLSDAGVAAAQGVLCDWWGRVLGRPDTYAVGDVAAWRDPADGQHQRFEHWTNAVDQAHAVALTMLGRPTEPPARPLPYFWSDQHGIKIQMIGHPARADRVQITDLPDKPGRLTATYFLRDRLVAAVAFGAPAWLARHRPLVAAGASEDELHAGTTGAGRARR